MVMTLPSRPPAQAGRVSANHALTAELEALRAENAALRTRVESRLTLKVSEKGAVSLYGLRRFPVTFYADEWNRIETMLPRITAFIRENAASMSVKRQPGA